ncbi:MAG: hypothetical protein Tp125SUR00d2C35697761_24 [Prokaryotic dsDNA virus sp.]|nr:MAG: hypothetical protein Tp125SUR00d2C35697761_24 [Prokaryotic dsDNA virus sp.]
MSFSSKLQTKLQTIKLNTVYMVSQSDAETAKQQAVCLTKYTSKAGKHSIIIRVNKRTVAVSAQAVARQGIMQALANKRRHKGISKFEYIFISGTLTLLSRIQYKQDVYAKSA